MQDQLITPKEARLSFIDGVFDKRYLLTLVCLVLYTDIAYSFLSGWQHTILDMRLTEIDKDISFGLILVGAVCFFLFMSCCPRLRLEAQTHIPGLAWFFTRKYAHTIPRDYVYKHTVRMQAITQKNSVLYSEYTVKHNLDKHRQKLDDLRFAVLLLMLVDFSLGLSLYRLIIPRLSTSNLITWAPFIALLLVWGWLFRSLRPFYEDEGYIYLPGYQAEMDDGERGSA